MGHFLRPEGGRHARTPAQCRNRRAQRDGKRIVCTAWRPRPARSAAGPATERDASAGGPGAGEPNGGTPAGPECDAFDAGADPVAGCDQVIAEPEFGVEPNGDASAGDPFGADASGAGVVAIDRDAPEPAGGAERLDRSALAGLEPNGPSEHDGGGAIPPAAVAPDDPAAGEHVAADDFSPDDLTSGDFPSDDVTSDQLTSGDVTTDDFTPNDFSAEHGAADDLAAGDSASFAGEQRIERSGAERGFGRPGDVPARHGASAGRVASRERLGGHADAGSSPQRGERRRTGRRGSWVGSPEPGGQPGGRAHAHPPAQRGWWPGDASVDGRRRAGASALGHDDQGHQDGAPGRASSRA